MKSANILRLRQRGGLLIEAVLALAVAMSLVGLSAGFIESESNKQERIMIASEQDVLLEASRNFVQQRYHDILQDLYHAADANGEAILAYSMDDIIEAGFLPASYNGGVLNNLYGQEYAMLARAVNRNDSQNPPDTMTFADIDPGAAGNIHATLTDGDPSNGEMDIESILVTHGGDALRPGLTGDVVGLMQAPFSGVVNVAGTASGAYNNFSMDLSGFEDLSEYPGEGHFASVVSLSSYGIMGSLNDREYIVDPFRRCVDVNISSPEYEDCLASNEVYTDIVMRPHDTDGNGTPDRYPAIRNVTMLDCADSGNTSAAGTFRIDCSSTSMSGNLTVDGEVRVGAVTLSQTAVNIEGKQVIHAQNVGATMNSFVTADRLVSEQLNGGQDMNEVISNSRVVRAGDTVTKPTCPAVTASGANPMEPRIYVSPAAYADPYGRPVVGVRAFAEDASSTEWRVRLLVYVAQDFCTNDASTPINLSALNDVSDWYSNRAPRLSNCSVFSENLPNAPTLVTNRGDNKSDVYELTGNAAAVIAQTRCY